LFGNVGIGPTIGHAHFHGHTFHVHPHGYQEPAPHEHAEHHAHGAVCAESQRAHDPAPTDIIEQEERHHEFQLVAFEESYFHLHGHILGIPYTLPIPTDSDGRRDSQITGTVQGLFVTVICRNALVRAVAETNLSTDGWGLPVNVDIDNSLAIRHSSFMPFAAPLQHPCAPGTQSGVLRC
jgi:hypothetical protein